MIFLLCVFLYLCVGAFTLGISGNSEDCDEVMFCIFLWPVLCLVLILKFPFKAGTFVRNRYLK